MFTHASQAQERPCRCLKCCIWLNAAPFAIAVLFATAAPFATTDGSERPIQGEEKASDTLGEAASSKNASEPALSQQTSFLSCRHTHGHHGASCAGTRTHTNALPLYGDSHVPKPGAFFPLLPLLMQPLLFLRKSLSLGFFSFAAFRGHS